MAAWMNSPFLNNLKARPYQHRRRQWTAVNLTSPSLHQAISEPDEPVGGIDTTSSDKVPCDQPRQVLDESIHLRPLAVVSRALRHAPGALTLSRPLVVAKRA